MNRRLRNRCGLVAHLNRIFITDHSLERTTLNASLGGFLGIIEVEVIQWRKHQRKDVKKPSWFALDNRILEDAKLFGLSDPEWKALIYVFCQASQQNSQTAKINLHHAAKVCGITEKVLNSCLSQLDHAGVTRTTREQHASGTRTSLHRTGQDKTLQDKRGSLPVLSDAAPENPSTVYCELWKTRNGKRPPFGKKEAGQLKRIADDLGPTRTAELIRTYFSMPDPFYIKRGYDVTTFCLNTSAIAQFEANGKIVTKAAVEQIEKQVDKIQRTKRGRSIEELERERADMLADAQKQLPSAGGHK